MESWMYILLFSPGLTYAAPEPDYIGMVAAEAAYAALLPANVQPDKPEPRPVDPNCPTCKGKGKVPSGDGQGWSNCPTCQPLTEVLEKPELPKAKVTLPPGPFLKPQHSSAVTPPSAPKPAAAAPVAAPPVPCANGTCPVEKAAPAAPLSGIPLVPVPVSPRRIFRRR